MGGCLAKYWQVWAQWGAEDWVIQVLKKGYRIPFASPPPLFFNTKLFSQHCQGESFAFRVSSPSEEGSSQAGSSNPGLLQLYVCGSESLRSMETNHRPLSSQFICGLPKFHLETPQSVLQTVRQRDWMVSLDLAEAYLQIQIHQESRRYLSFVAQNGIFQFWVLCFGLTTAPQVFTWVMAPISVIKHRMGFRLVRYPDDWLVLDRSREETIRVRDFLLHLCHMFGIQ